MDPDVEAKTIPPAGLLAHSAALLTLSLCLLACIAARPVSPDPKGWFIESYRNGDITVLHERKIYKATCDVSRSFNNAASIIDPENVHQFASCDLAIDLIGRTLQPFDGKQKDSEGRIVVMWNVGSTLALRSWRDERTPWRFDEFKIASVTLQKSP